MSDKQNLTTGSQGAQAEPLEERHEMPTFAQAVDMVDNLRQEFKSALHDTGERSVRLDGPEYADLRRACLVLKGQGNQMIQTLKAIAHSGAGLGLSDLDPAHANCIAIAYRALTLIGER